jgi:hypothetical protein
MIQPIQNTLLNISVEAGTDLTTLKRFVKLSSGSLVLCGAGELAIGVIQSEVNSGEEAPVMTHGIAIVEVGSGGVTSGTEVMSDATGKAVAWAHPVAGGTYAAAEVNALFDKKVLGIAMDTVSAGAFTRVILK